MGRIRTIKPEFWRHEDLSALPEATHMLAAALLNYADDEGYFNANERLIQAECFPLRDLSVTIHGALMDLSSIGYVRLGEGSDGRKYGQILKFSQHQVISRPTKSKIATLSIAWHGSATTHGAIHEPSMPEGNGKEGKGREQEQQRASAPTDAAAAQDGPTDREKLLAAMGADPVSGMIGPNGKKLGTMADTEEAAKWAALGLSIADQCGIIAEVMERQRMSRPGFTPKSFSYFTDAMADHKARRDRPVPEGSPTGRGQARTDDDKNMDFLRRVAGNTNR